MLVWIWMFQKGCQTSIDCECRALQRVQLVSCKHHSTVNDNHDAYCSYRRRRDIKRLSTANKWWRRSVVGRACTHVATSQWCVWKCITSAAGRHVCAERLSRWTGRWTTQRRRRWRTRSAAADAGETAWWIVWSWQCTQHPVAIGNTSHNWKSGFYKQQPHSTEKHIDAVSYMWATHMPPEPVTHGLANYCH